MKQLFCFTYFLFLLPLLSGTHWDCFDQTCWGRGPSANNTIACDNTNNFCVVGFGGYPRCIRVDSYQHVGNGVRCYGQYTCGADSAGRAVCVDQDYRELVLFIVVAAVVVMALLVGCCCYGRWRNVRDGYSEAYCYCFRKAGREEAGLNAENLSEYTELVSWLERKRLKRQYSQNPSVIYSTM